MMFPLLVYLLETRHVHGVVMERFYSCQGITRQAVHQYKQAREAEQEMMKEVASLVKAYRQEKDRRAGSRSLFYNLGIRELYGIGVNKFERLMARYGLTLAPLRIRVVTTRSCFQSWNYPNLIKGLTLSNINELVVGDLTYVQLGKHRYFLFCLTDVYSGRIVGHCFHWRMRAKEALVALEMWVELRGHTAVRGCIHHTDGGSQYFAVVYMAPVTQYGLRVSVAGNCLDNAYAEQRNGLIKHHLLPLIRYTEGPQLYKEVDRVIHCYNHERKQEGLGWLTPVEYEQQILKRNEPEYKQIFDPDER